MAESMRVDFPNYLTELGKAFADERDDSPDYLFAMKKNADEDEFLWKKIIPSDDLKIHLGTFKLRKEVIPSNVVEPFNEILIQMRRLQNTVAKLTATNEQISCDISKANIYLTELVDVKETTEKELFTKFALVLNQKKDEIRNLHKQLDQLKCESKKTTESATNKDAVSVRDLKSSDESFNQVNLSFDDEDNSEPGIPTAPPKKAKSKRGKSEIKNITASSSSRTKFQLLEDSSESNADDLLSNM